MSTLEDLPDEIFMKITGYLNSKDRQACRIVSSIMREKTDRIFAVQLCVTLNEKSERDFVAKKKPKLMPPFTRMRIGSVSYLTGSGATVIMKKRAISFRKEYFERITDLEITEFVPKQYFHQVMKLTTGNLRILKLNSAVLGGTKNLFAKDIGHSGNSIVKTNSMLFLRRALPQPLVENILKHGRNRQALGADNKMWDTLEELHIKLDYLCPSTPNFSPHWLVENLKNVQSLPVPKLNVFSVTVEKSKEAEIFYFTINSLLNFIPLSAYSSLKSVSVVSPKCRPNSQQENLEICQTSKNSFSQMQLSDLTVKVYEGHHHALPQNLLAILKAQKHSLDTMTVTIEGLQNAHVLKLVN